MADDELETLIASTLCAAVQRIVCLTFPTSADRQEHGDRRLRILGYDPAALDDFVEVFLRDDGPNKSA
jgi:hypothetical protein